MAPKPERLLRTFGGGPPLSEQGIRAFESGYRLVLPPRYRAFLAETNGGRPERDLFETSMGADPRRGRVRFFFGLEEPVGPCHLGWQRGVLAGRVPDDWLAIGTTDAADKICVSLHLGTISLWDGDTGRLGAVAASFDEFVQALRHDSFSPKPNSSIWSVRKP